MIDSKSPAGGPLQRKAGVSQTPPKRSDSGQAQQERDARQNTDPVPKLTLPKPGGALRGIGEKLAINAPMGSIGMSLPIPVPTARGAPQLALSYSQGGGNGPFGVGWNLDIPRIDRKTDTGLPTYCDEDESDTFIQSGAEDLQAVLSADGGEWGTEDIDEAEPGYVGRLYRPRTEGSFARIERLTNKSDPADVWWRTISKDNTTSIFGHYPDQTLGLSDSDAKIRNPDIPAHVFSWLLTETRTARGERTVYEYKAENNDPDDNAIHESPSRQGANAQRYLKRIHFGNRENAASGDALPWLFMIVFDYGEHGTGPPSAAEVETWRVRPDAFSTYRPRFEVRSRRRCQRIACFHNLQELAGQPSPVPTTSLNLNYDNSQAGCHLISASTTHYRWDASASTYESDSGAPLEFKYTAAAIDPTSKTLTRDELAAAPQGISGPYQFIDLDGEGVSGILSEQGHDWYFSRNLGGGRFRSVGGALTRPGWASLSDGAQISALENDGQPYVAMYGTHAGYAARLNDGSWSEMQRFDQLPSVSFQNPSIRHLDLTGDGKPDLALLQNDTISWYPNRARQGYGADQRGWTGHDEEHGPARIFQNNLESIFTADMTGDGLQDLVRIRCSDVTYWPNLGFGTFGGAVCIGHSPRIATADAFDPARLRLADIDGSGTTDLLYLDGAKTRYWINQSGNQFGSAVEIPGMPDPHSLGSAAVIDLLGTGTSCLVWSSPLERDGSAPLRYIDLQSSTKPGLLCEMNNNMGAITQFRYAPSSKFYLGDRARGSPWVTKIPFIVHVLEEVRTRDVLSGNVHTSRYAYHHGYYDRAEREFRGFGMVEEWQSEGRKDDGTTLFERELTLKRSWFHTGAWIEEARISDHFKHDYFTDPKSFILDDSEIENEDGLSARGLREAKRALRGQPLRVELYACSEPDDDAATPRPQRAPYTIVETRYRVREIQPVAAGNLHGVFHSIPAETLTHTYEQNAKDPRVSHDLVLRSDEFGNVLARALISYPRRSSETDYRRVEHDACLVQVQEEAFINHIVEDSWRYVGLPVSTLGWELVLSKSDVPQNRLFERDELQSLLDSAPLHTDVTASPAGTAKCLIAASIQTYRPDADALSLDAPSLDLGQVESLALPSASYQLVMTEGARSVLASDLLKKGGPVALDDVNIEALGYLDPAAKHSDLPQLQSFLAQGGLSNGWWASGAMAAHDPAIFFGAVAARDPYGTETQITYDNEGLLPVKTTLAAGSVLEQTITALNDYRLLMPWQVTDANGNRHQVAFDVRGRVTASAFMDSTGTKGDTLDHPAVSTTYHDKEVFGGTSLPNFVHSKARDTHFSDDPSEADTRWVETRVYSDGFGRELLTKTSVAAGRAYMIADGELTEVHSDPRWAGSGRTLFDNKGNPVEQWEPYFSTTPAFEGNDQLSQWGVTPRLYYDPLNRLVRTEFPDGTVTKVENTAWAITSWDANDMVADSEWYLRRTVSTHENAVTGAAASRAAAQAVEHANTPSVQILDTLARPVRAILHNIDAVNGIDEKNETRTVLDLAGNARTLIDANGNTALSQIFDLAGRPFSLESNDAGRTLQLATADGQPAWSWLPNDHCSQQTYDGLRRPREFYDYSPGATQPALREALLYGEQVPDAANENLIGQIWRIYDAAGLVEMPGYDFKGNPRETTRFLHTDPLAPLDWGAETLGDAAQRPASLGESFTAKQSIGAMGQVLTSIAPDGSKTNYAYDAGGALIGVESVVNGPSGPVARQQVSGVTYNEKGQREQITYGSGADKVRTVYAYDTESFRLTRMTSTGPAGVIQDLSYTYDPNGNNVEIGDAVQDVIFSGNQATSPDRQFVYDGLDRLVEATGREHPGQVGAETFTAPNGETHTKPPLPHAKDTTGLRQYVQRWSYDAAGNILKWRHICASDSAANWTRTYTYDYQSGGNSNRLLETKAGKYAPIAYAHDGAGSITSCGAHLTGAIWNAENQPEQFTLNGNVTAHYRYDAGGERVHKIVDKGAVREERIYLGGYEVYRRWTISGGSQTLTLRRDTLHVMDDQARIALVETEKTIDGLPAGAPVQRTQLGDHLESASWELGEAGQVLTYEEYHAYGTTAWYWTNGAVSQKRYRYTAKERDDESGFAYHSARYYIPAIGRWLSSDPAGFVDGPCTYAYARGSPVSHTDASGTQTDEEECPKEFIAKDEAANNWGNFNLDKFGILLDEFQIVENKSWRLNLSEKLDTIKSSIRSAVNTIGSAYDAIMLAAPKLLNNFNLYAKTVSIFAGAAVLGMFDELKARFNSPAVFQEERHLTPQTLFLKHVTGLGKSGYSFNEGDPITEEAKRFPELVNLRKQVENTGSALTNYTSLSKIDPEVYAGEVFPNDASRKDQLHAIMGSIRIETKTLSVDSDSAFVQFSVIDAMRAGSTTHGPPDSAGAYTWSLFEDRESGPLKTISIEISWTEKIALKKARPILKSLKMDLMH